MTTTVTITAHCSEGVEVHVTTLDGNSPIAQHTLQNGEEHVVYAYGSQSLLVKEVVK